jgi:polysaccharide biosynthesis protein PslG
MTRSKVGLGGILAALLAALALLLPAASAQARVGRSFWGVVPSPGMGLTIKDLDMMRQAKVGIVRSPVYQEDIEPSPGNFDFTPTDALIGYLASRGIPTLPDLVVSQTNPPPPISGSAAQTWQAFVQGLVGRYGPGGSYWSGPYQQDHPGGPIIPVTSWQVYNEPNLHKYFPSSSPVRDYAKLLSNTSSSIRGIDPNAKIVLAGMPTLLSKYVPFPGWKFLDKLYQVPGAKADFDIASAHPYAENLDQLRLAMKKIRGAMKRHGDKRTQVWITELGYGSDRFNHHLNFGLAGQAKMLRKTFHLLLDRRNRWKVRGVVWYDWRDPPVKNPDCSFCSSAGLLRADSSGKPAFGAYKRFTGAGP